MMDPSFCRIGQQPPEKLWRNPGRCWPQRALGVLGTWALTFVARAKAPAGMVWSSPSFLHPGQPAYIPTKSVQLGQVMSAITLMLHSFLMRFNPSDVCLNSQGIRTGIRCIMRQDFVSVHVQSHTRQLYALTSPNHGISMGCGTAVLQLHGLGDLKL